MSLPLNDLIDPVSQSRHVSQKPLGLIAGWGRYPVLLAQRLSEQGRPVYCLAVRDHADPALANYVERIVWLGLGQLGRAIRLFRRWGVEEATLVGKIHKVTLLQPWMVFHHWPDWVGFRTFAPHFLHHVRDNRDDTLLTTVCNAFELAGIRIRPATDYLPEILISPGQITPQAPTPRQWADICFGWRVAKEMGRLDIGQTVVVKDQTVLAVEAIEGTDPCLRRAGELCPVGGFTVVKVAKPQQDMRFDVPTVGVRTLENIASGKGSVLAVEAGKTIFLDPDAVLSIALRHRIAIVAVTAEDIAAHAKDALPA
ncbi:MAG: UDP-2,3-diacylglucosamine diphosphatase LpxI [Thermogutta sp.]